MTITATGLTSYASPAGTGLRWLPEIVAVVAGIGTLAGGIFLLAWIIQPPTPTHASRSIDIRILEPPQPVVSDPPPRTSRPRPAPAPLAPTPSLPGLDLPALNDALVLPAIDADPLAPVDWTPRRAVLPSMPAPTPVSESGDAPARRLVMPDLSTDYPRRARRRGIEGRTVVRLEVDATGTVQAVTILRSEPAGIFERAARRAARRLRYEPAVANGRPIESEVDETFVWSLR